MGECLIVRRGGDSGACLNVGVYTSLPSTVINNQIAVITNYMPTNIIVDSNEPSKPTLYDVWIELEYGDDVITLGNSGSRINIRPGYVYQYTGNHCATVDAYLGSNGLWKQVSFKILQMGVAYNTANSSPVLTRLGAAVGKVAVAGIGTVPQVSDFDRMPIFRDIKLCNLAPNGTVTAYEGDAGFTRNGTNGDVMVEIPAFWYKIVSGTTEEWWIANGPASGYTIHPAFKRSTSLAQLEKIYVSAYEASAGYVSKSGIAALTGITRAQSRTGVTNKGAKWSQLDIATVMAINLLMYIEYANLNIQSAIGEGVSLGSKINTGGSDSMTGHTGRAAGTATSAAVKWRNIENWWANVWAWVDGININGGSYYWCLVPANYADNVTRNYTSAGFSVPTNLFPSFIKTMGRNASHPWFRVPAAAGGTETTYYCDGVYTNTGWRVAEFGGTAGAGDISGPASWSFYDSSTTATAVIGCRLLYLP